ncbi:MAG: Ig-like domain-containing protein [Pirellulales bacterium]
MAGTTPDIYELKGVSPTYDAGYFVETPKPVPSGVDASGRTTYDFRIDTPGDQSVRFKLSDSLDTRRIRVDPSQSYQLATDAANGEGSLVAEAFDSSGGSLGRITVPFLGLQADLAQYSTLKNVAILGPGGVTLPTSTDSISIAEPDDLSRLVTFGFQADDIEYIDTATSVNHWHDDQMLKVNLSSSYQLSAFVSMGSNAATSQLHSLGFEAFDADKLLIEAVHVQRYADAADARLTSPLNPGDTVVRLDTTLRWAATSLDPANRSLAWYGYVDGKGTSYADYTYTRNVLRDAEYGAWPTNGISGNVITLSKPWAGPALPVGTAMRNTVDNSSLFAVLQDRLPVIGYTQTTLSGTWLQGTPSKTNFPSGTAYARLAAWTNLTSISIDEPIVIRMSWGTDQAVPTYHKLVSNRRAETLDVLANDPLATRILAITQPVYGQASIVTDGTGRTSIAYQSGEYQIGADFFEYVALLQDGSTTSERVYVNLLGGNLDGDPILQTQVSQSSNYVLYPTNFLRSAVKNQQLIEEIPNAEGLIGFVGPAYVYLEDVATQTGAITIRPNGSFRFTPLPNSMDDFYFNYQQRTNAETRLSRPIRIQVLESECRRDQTRLAQLALAELNFEATFRKLFYDPAASSYFTNNLPNLSWRVLLLPYLGTQASELFSRFKLDEPWNSANNLPLLNQMPDVFRSAGDGSSTTNTRFQVIADTGSTFFINLVDKRTYKNRFADATDGLTNTVLIVQSGADKAVPWTKPDELPFNAANPIATLGNVGSYFNVAFADGQVRALPVDMGNLKFQSLAQINDNTYVDAANETRRAKKRTDFPGDPIVYNRAYLNFQLRAIVLANHNYENSYKRLPAAGTKLSWRVQILPYLDASVLYQLFRQDLPWDDPINLALLDKMPDVFRAVDELADSSTTRVRVLGGPNMMYASGLTDTGPKFSDVTDGFVNSILFVQAGINQSVVWTQPDVMPAPAGNIWDSLGNHPDGKMPVGMVDGSIREIPTSAPAVLVRGLATINAGDSGWSVFETAIGDLRLRSQSTMASQIMSIIIGSVNYETTYKFLPNNFIGSLSTLPTGSVGLSWRVAILPFIKETNLYNQFHLNEPWDSPHNLSLLPQMPSVYKTSFDVPYSYNTRIQRFTGPNTVDPMKRIKSTNVPDGTSETVLIAVTAPEDAVPWTKPDDIDYATGQSWSSLGKNVPFTLLGYVDGQVRPTEHRDEYVEYLDGFSLDLLVHINDGVYTPTITRRTVLHEGDIINAISFGTTSAINLGFDDSTMATAASTLERSPDRKYQRVSLAANSDRNGRRETKLNIAVPGSPLSNEQVTVVVVDNDPNLRPTIDQVNFSVNEDSGAASIPLTGISAGGSESQPLRVTISSNSSIITAPSLSYTAPNSTGQLNFSTIPDLFGTATVLVMVEDGGPDNLLATFTDNLVRVMTATINVLPINDAPKLNPIQNYVVDEDSAAQSTSLSGILAGGGEVQPLKVTAISSNPILVSNPLATYNSPNQTGQLTWAPNTDQFGQSVITVIVEDGGNDSNLSTTSDNATTQQLFTITVNPVNDAPLLDVISDITVNEDPGIQTTNLTGVLAGGGESQPLRVTAVSSNPTYIADPQVIYISPDSTGQLRWNPIPETSGQAVITVMLEDGGLDSNLATTADNATTQRQFTITVIPVNDAPLIDTIVDVAVNEDSAQQTTGLTGIFAGGGELQPLKVTAISSNPSMIADPQVTYTSANQTGQLTWIPLADQFGQSVITVIVEDGGFDLDLGTVLDNATTQRKFTITVNPINDLPSLDAISNVVVNEDPGIQTTPLSGILAGASESQPLRVTAVSSNPAIVGNPTVVYTSPNSVGQLDWSPAADQFGQAIITVTVEDGGNDSDLATAVDNLTVQRQFTITVNSVNDTPLIDTIPEISVNEDAGVQTTILSGILAGGGESQPLKVNASSSNPALIANPQVTYSSPNSSGQLTWVTAADQSGQTVITITIEDGGFDLNLSTTADNATTERQFTITVNPVDDAPLLDSIANITVNEDVSSQTANLSGIFAGGGESQPLMITAVSSNPGLVANPSVTYNSPAQSGSLTWVPLPDQFGQAIITVTLEDGGNDLNLATTADNATTQRLFTITVSPINDIPQLNPISDLTVDEDPGIQTVNLSGVLAGGGEAQPLRVTAISSKPSLIANLQVVYNSPNSTGELRWSPVADQFGQAVITVSVEDGGNDSDLQTVADNATTQRQFTIVVNPINDQPLLDSISNISVNEDAATQSTNLTGLFAGGGESQPLSITVVSNNPGLIANPQVSYSSPSSTGQLSWIPIADQFGQAVITVSVEDGGLDLNLATTADNATTQRSYTITVNPINDTPQLDALANRTVDEDSGQQTLDLVGILAGGGEAQPLRVTAISSNTLLIANPQVVYNSPDATGQLRWSPAADQFGQVVITVSVEDGGNDSDLSTIGDNAITQRQLTVTVNPVNDAPEIDVVGNLTMDEDSATQTIVLTGIRAGGGESQPLIVTAVSSDPTLIANPVVTYSSPESTARLTLTPSADLSGQVVIDVAVEDGGLDNDLATKADNLTTKRQFTISVNPVNDLPQLDAVANVVVDEDVPQQTTDLHGILAGGNESQPLRITTLSNNPQLIASPQLSYLSPNTEAQLRWQPAAGLSGTAVISIIVEDGGLDQDLSTVSDNATLQRQFTITINPINDTPLIDGLANVTTTEDSPLQTTLLSGISAGFAENQPLRVVATSNNSELMSNLQVSYTSPNSSGLLTWIPQPDHYGQATITVVVEDGGLDLDLATTSDNAVVQRQFVITINPINDVPTIDAISNYSIQEDDPQQITQLVGISAGGNELQPLRVTAVSNNPALVPSPSIDYSGTNSTGKLNWAPSADRFGTAVITVSVEDGGLDGDLATASDNAIKTTSFTINVQPENDVPHFESIPNVIVQKNSAQQTTQIKQITDGSFENQQLTFHATSSNPSLVPNPQISYLSPSSTGQAVWQPKLNQSGTADITITISDGLAEYHQTFTVVVNAPPVAKSDQAVTLGARVVDISVLQNDSDAETSQANLMIGVVQAPPAIQGTVILVGQQIRFQAAPNFFGVSSFTYQVSDDMGGSTTSSVSVGVAKSAKQNPWNPLDVNRNSLVSPSDALLIVNFLNDPSQSRIVGLFTSPYDLDVNGDNRISPSDVLTIVNYLNQKSAGGEAEQADQTSNDLFAVDAYYEDLELMTRRHRSRN